MGFIDGLRIKPLLAVLAATLTVVAVACSGGDDPTATTRPTSTPRAATATVPAPTAIPTASGPTATVPAGSTATAVPVATATTVPDTAVDLDYASVESLLESPAYNPEWGTPTYGGVVKIRNTWPQTGNSPWYFSVYRQLYVNSMYSALLRLDPWQGYDGPLHPDVAESWEVSSDGTSYTFQLRRGVMFRDPIPQDAAHGVDDMPGRGTELTCEDVQASVEFWGTDAWAVEKAGSSRGDMLQMVTSTSCPDGPDGFTFLLQTEFPSAITLANLAVPALAMVDKDWLEWLLAEHPGEVNRQNWYLNMGTGANLEEDHQQDIVTKLRRNPTYWREGLPLVDGIDVHVIRDFATAFTAWASGQIDILGQASGSMTAGQVQQARRDFSDKPLYTHLYTGGQGLVYNTISPPFDDVRVRKAADLVIDRQVFHQLKFITGDLYKSEIAAQTAPGSFWGNPIEDVLTWPGYRQPKDEDIAEANRLLDEVYGPGERPEITCVSRTDQNYIEICLFANEMFHEYLDMKVNNNFSEGVVATEMVNNCNYDASSGWPNGLEYVDDPTDQYSPYHSGLKGFIKCKGGVDSEVQARIDGLVDQILRELDPVARREYTMEVEKIITLEAYYGSSLEYQQLYYGGQTWMKGVLFPNQGQWHAHPWLWERVWKDK